MGAVSSFCVHPAGPPAEGEDPVDLVSFSIDLDGKGPPGGATGPYSSTASRQGVAVPSVPHWSKVTREAQRLRRDPGQHPQEAVCSPPMSRRSALDQMMTPRGNIGGEFRTPRLTPRTPRSSSRTEGDPSSSEVCYEGGYLGNMKHGSGWLRMEGCTYAGGFRHNSKHGRGTMSWDDGREYCGQFDHGRFQGSAVMTWPDGRRYCGQYVDDRKDGFGTFSWQDGRCYQGQWVSGKRHGVGTYTNAKGLTRKGAWEMDCPVAWDAPPPGSLEEARERLKARPRCPRDTI
mmetsp:Transcript_63185/g.142765  ORF Transcript_63185/g.142765 Transcript_63185/m.142765 type:complete len:288 (-) Transcript_63185:107-970(-)